jgi:YfiR/HmsC-like
MKGIHRQQFVRGLINTRYLFIFFLVTFCRLGLADPTMQEYSVQAIRTLNLARFTEWSASALSSRTTAAPALCVLGNRSMHSAFEQLEKPEAGNKTIRMVHVRSPADFDQCRILFISGDEAGVSGLLRKAMYRHVLTIGEHQNFLREGGMVQLAMNRGAIRMNINLKAVRQAGLRINSKVLRLANVVKEADGSLP